MDWVILDKRHSRLVLIMMILVAVVISGLVAGRPGRSQPFHR